MVCDVNLDDDVYLDSQISGNVCQQFNTRCCSCEQYKLKQACAALEL